MRQRYHAGGGMFIHRESLVTTIYTMPRLGVDLCFSHGVTDYWENEDSRCGLDTGERLAADCVHSADGSQQSKSQGAVLGQAATKHYSRLAAYRAWFSASAPREMQHPMDLGRRDVVGIRDRMDGTSVPAGWVWLCVWGGGPEYHLATLARGIVLSMALLSRTSPHLTVLT